MKRTYDWNGNVDVPISSPGTSDEEVARQVRMLLRSDLNHEVVLTMARDRIMALVKEKEQLQEQIKAASELINESLLQEKELDYYKSGSQRRPPRYVPKRVRLLQDVRGDGPCSDTIASAGEHDCTCNKYGAVSVMATNGTRLGVRLYEFEVIEWHDTFDKKEGTWLRNMCPLA